MTDSRPNVAIVIPVFNEEPVLPELFARLEALFRANPDCSWRAVFVNDGSRDRSVEMTRAQSLRDPPASPTPGMPTPRSPWTPTCRTLRR